MEGKITTVFDLETADADLMYTGGHRGDFVRLAGALDICGSPVTSIASVTSAPDGLFLEQLLRADVLVGHNVQRFDIPALARHYQTDSWELARKTVDTLVLARLADPPGARGQKPWSEPGYYSLDAVAARLGVAGTREHGKGLLGVLADRYGGLDRIPAHDTEYRAYLRDDLHEQAAVYAALLPSLDAYARREMHVAAIQSRMTLNGWRIDTTLLAARVRAEVQRQQEALEELHGTYGLPERGRKNPLGTKAGKEWFRGGLEALGMTVPRTPKGGVSISGDALTALRMRTYSGSPAARVLDLMLVCAGVTAKYAEIQNHLIGDRVYAGIGQDQASGRWAMTRPSLTNLGKRGAAKIAQRGVFLPEVDHVLMAFDMDQVDMRGIAGLSQDKAYAALFEPGMDAHAEIAQLVLGDRSRREEAKPIGHGWNYGRGSRAISDATGIPLETCQQFDREMVNRFPVVCSWREEIRELGSAGVLIDNGFGRKMRCDPQRAYTQAPALAGQGSARDLMCEGLLRLDPQVHAMLRGVVHDEVVLSVPREQADDVRQHVLDALTFTWRDVPITAGASRPGADWAACYAKG